MGLLGRIYLLVALAVIPAFALLALIHYQGLEQREAAAEAEALRSARLISGEMEQVLAAVKLVLSTAAAAPVVTSLEEPACTAYLRRLQETTPSAATIAVAGADGIVRCGATSGLSIADRPHFASALNTQDLVIGTYTIGRASGISVLPLALRIETAAGPAVMAMSVRLDWIREHFLTRYFEFPPRSSLTVIDREGTILVRLPNREREGSQLSLYPFLVETRTGGTFRSTAEETADGVARFVGYTSPHEGPAAGFSVAVGLPQAPVLAELRAQAQHSYLLLGLIAALSFAAAALGGRLFIHKPVAHLLVVIGAWRSGDMAARVKLQGLPRQFAQVGRAFNDMAADLEAALQHKDMLLRELNHRVMNSFTMVGSLLRLQSRTISDGESRALFESSVGRLKALALVYKCIQSIDGVEAVDFAGFLHDLCGGLHASLGSDKGCVIEAEDLRLPPEQATPLTLIVNELVTNALKHGSREAGPVRVTLRRSAERCRVAVRNGGSLAADHESRRKGFGMKMVAAMARQIRGEVETAATAGEVEVAVTFTPAIPQPPLREPARAGEAAAADPAEPAAFADRRAS